jgi:predicted nucleotidyltransferase
MPFEEDEADEETNNVDIVESAIVKDVDHHFNAMARSKVMDCLVSDVVNKMRAIRDAFILAKSS